MGRPKKIKFPIAWHEECLKYSKLSLQRKKDQVATLLADIDRHNESNQRLEKAIEKAKKKGLTEFPVVD